MKKYDYEKLQRKFTTMSNNALRMEYAKVINEIRRLYNTHMDETQKLNYLEPLENARMYLEGYFAMRALFNCGFYERLDGQLCFDNEKGKDILH